MAHVIDAVAREAAVWALKMENRRRFYEAQDRRGERRSRGGRKCRCSAVNEEGA